MAIRVSELRTASIRVPMTATERRALQRLAKLEGLPMAVVLRRLVRDALRKATEGERAA